jgi:hypothetical protein
MGAREALEFLDVLWSYRLLTKRTVRQYVMEALYSGTEVRSDTPAYEALKRSVCNEASKSLREGVESPRIGGGREARLDPETADYLRRIISSAAGDKSALFLANAPYNGFTRDAYEEVSDLLGKYGRRHLGISGRLESLKPDPRRVRAMLYDEMLAEEQEHRKQIERNSSDSPLDQYLPEMTEQGDIHWPELEPFPGSEETGEDLSTYRKRHAACEGSK